MWRRLRRDEGVGHGFFYVRDQMRFNTALLAFLQRHIGGDDTFVERTAPPAAAASAASSVR